MINWQVTFQVLITQHEEDMEDRLNNDGARCQEVGEFQFRRTEPRGDPSALWKIAPIAVGPLSPPINSRVSRFSESPLDSLRLRRSGACTPQDQ
jgi:hypothetical protein